MIKNQKIEITHPKNQLSLFGYDSYFKSFAKLFEKEEMPHCVLLSGSKGLGKSTFVYHFINYLLSHNEKNKYSLKDLEIDPNNVNYKLICNNTHPNFFLLESTLTDENIKIEQVRNLLKFLNKTTYSRNIKIVMIDNSEYLNLNSSNALLKALEEPNSNTFFFIIHNSSVKILDTIKSRCIEFKFFFNKYQKKRILENIIRPYKLDFNLNNLDENFYFDTPGNLLKYLLIFNDSNIDISNDRLSCILYLIEKYNSQKDSELLTIVSVFIEHFYNELSLNNNKNLNNYFINKYKILNQINDMKKYNLNKKNLLISLYEILENEKR